MLVSVALTVMEDKKDETRRGWGAEEGFTIANDFIVDKNVMDL